eukprot:gene17375-20729_t
MSVGSLAVDTNNNKMLKITKKLIVIAVAASLVIIGLTIGLAVGLTRNKHNGPGGPYPVMVISKLEMVQTHVLAEEGRRWELSAKNVSLHLTANRQTMFLVYLVNSTEIESPILEVFISGLKAGEVALNPPYMLPPTESNGTSYSTTAWSAVVPREWMKPGLSVLVSADNYEPSLFRPLKVGMDTHMDLRTLPMYLFGCTPGAKCGLLNETGAPLQKYVDELYQKWPMSTLSPVNHPAKYIEFPYLIFGPAGKDQPAFKGLNTDMEREGFEIMGITLSLLGSIRSANGESSTSNQYYAPLLMLDAAGDLSGPGGGLGTVGGSTGVGDDSYAGIFIHEQGHAFGLPHAGDAYPARYPYIQGSLNGSTWGFDFNHNQFLATFIPTSADYYPRCVPDAVQDPEGRCVKQNVMQGGSGDQAAGYRYTIFADYDMGVMQAYLEGKVIYDPSFSSGYKQWDETISDFVLYQLGNGSNGLYGMDSGLPMTRDVPVATIIITLSTAGTADVSQVYPLITYTGNVRRWIDPTDPKQLEIVVPDSGDLAWYCHSEGCDYTLRVTYQDNSQIHVLLQYGYREWFAPEGPAIEGITDPFSGNSFNTIVFNAPATIPIKLVELLDTPYGYEGLPANPKVLVSRSF